MAALEIRPGTRPATSGQFQLPGPNWPRVTPGDSPGHFPTPGGRFGGPVLFFSVLFSKVGLLFFFDGLLFSYFSFTFSLLSTTFLTFERQEKTGKGARKNAQEKNPGRQGRPGTGGARSAPRLLRQRPGCGLLAAFAVICRNAFGFRVAPWQRAWANCH